MGKAPRAALRHCRSVRDHLPVGNAQRGNTRPPHWQDDGLAQLRACPAAPTKAHIPCYASFESAAEPNGESVGNNGIERVKPSRNAPRLETSILRAPELTFWWFGKIGSLS